MSQVKSRKPGKPRSIRVKGKKRNHGEDATMTLLAGARMVKSLAETPQMLGNGSKCLDEVGFVGGGCCKCNRKCNCKCRRAKASHSARGTFGRGGKCFQCKSPHKPHEPHASTSLPSGPLSASRSHRAAEQRCERRTLRGWTPYGLLP